MKKKKSTNAGFSLVEVLICLAIFTLIIIPILNAFRSSAVMNQKAHKLQAATSEAQNFIEIFRANPLPFLKALYQGDATRYSYSEQPEDADEEDRILTFKESGYISMNNAKYDVEIILNPSIYSNASDSSDASDVNTRKLPKIEDIDTVSNAVIASELWKYDSEAAFELLNNSLRTDDIDKKEITVTLTKTTTGSLKVTCRIIYTENSEKAEYMVYQSIFTPVLNDTGDDWKSGGDVYLFVSALTAGYDTVKIINLFNTEGDGNPNLDIHLIRGGENGSKNIGTVLLGNGVNTYTYMKVFGGTEEQKQPSGHANKYGMDFTTNIRAVLDESSEEGSLISQSSIMSEADSLQYEREEESSLRCYEITVNLYEAGTDKRVISLTSTIGAD